MSKKSDGNLLFTEVIELPSGALVRTIYDRSGKTTIKRKLPCQRKHWQERFISGKKTKLTRNLVQKQRGE